MRKLTVSLVSLAACIVLLYFNAVEYKNNIVQIILLSAGVISLLISAIFFMLFLYRNNKKKIKWLENRLEVWNGISYHVNQAGDEAFNQLPIGIIVYDEDFEIKWANRFAKSIFQSKLVDLSLNTIRDGIIDTIREKTPSFTVKAYDKFFAVTHNADNKLLYFFDDTQREELSKRYYEKITAIGIIMIDNLEESLKKFDVQEKSTIRGQILGEISDWVNSHNAYLQSYSEDRLVMVFDRSSLEKMISTKFDILNKIRDISLRNHLKTSVSIGIACYDVEYDELGTLAQSAMDLAEKRGGDQVVVNIQNEKIQYFGGKSNALEKNSLVQARVYTMALKEAVEKANNIYIMSHNVADCDAVGSMLGILKMIRSTTDNVRIIFDKTKADITVQRIFMLLCEETPELTKYFILPEEATDIRNNTLLIIVDTQSPKIVMFPEILAKVSDLIVIDHHRAGEIAFKEPIFSYIEPYASSTIELISEMFMFYNQNIELTQLEATFMLAGIVVDTNNFTFRTGSRTFEAASTLKSLGGNMTLVRTLLRDSIDIQQELAQALLNVEMVLGKFAIVKCPEDKRYFDRTMLARISERMLEIDGVEASFTVAKTQLDDNVSISARSLDKINVQLIMEIMGGGGHLNSAATQIKDKTINEVHDELIEIIKREYEDTGEENMKVILTSDVKGKGKKDQVIDVAAGYANYLFTNKLAVVASDENLKNLKDAEIKAKEEAENHRKLMEALKKEIESKSINVYIKIGANGKTFGQITSAQVAEDFEAQTGIHIDKRKIELPSDINSVGIYTATVVLHKDVSANIEIKVIEK